MRPIATEAARRTAQYVGIDRALPSNDQPITLLFLHNAQRQLNEVGEVAPMKRQTAWHYAGDELSAFIGRQRARA